MRERQYAVRDEFAQRIEWLHELRRRAYPRESEIVLPLAAVEADASEGAMVVPLAVEDAEDAISRGGTYFGEATSSSDLPIYARRTRAGEAWAQLGHGRICKRGHAT